MIEVGLGITATFQDGFTGEIGVAGHNDPQRFTLGVGVDSGNFEPMSRWCPVFHLTGRSIIIDIASVALEALPVADKAGQVLEITLDGLRPADNRLIFLYGW